MQSVPCRYAEIGTIRKQARVRRREQKRRDKENSERGKKKRKDKKKKKKEGAERGDRSESDDGSWSGDEAEEIPDADGDGYGDVPEGTSLAGRKARASRADHMAMDERALDMTRSQRMADLARVDAWEETIRRRGRYARDDVPAQARAGQAEVERLHAQRAERSPSPPRRHAPEAFAPVPVYRGHVAPPRGQAGVVYRSPPQQRSRQAPPVASVRRVDPYYAGGGGRSFAAPPRSPPTRYGPRDSAMGGSVGGGYRRTGGYMAGGGGGVYGRRGTVAGGRAVRVGVDRPW